MHRLLLFLLLFLWMGKGSALCKIDADCDPCHLCSADGICHQVPPFTDPGSHCGDSLICGVRSVCGPLAHCVLEHKPSCRCHYGTGLCLEEEQLLETNETKSSKTEQIEERLNPNDEMGALIMVVAMAAVFCVMIAGTIEFGCAYRQKETPLPVVAGGSKFFETRRMGVS